MSVKEIKWFKSLRGRYGHKTIVTFHALRDDGTFKTVDTTRNTIRVNLSFGSHPITKIEEVTKEDFHRELFIVISR